MNEIAFAALHCAGGDILIAFASVSSAIINGRQERYHRVAVTAIIIGLSYTLFSEWLNVEIRQSWAYRDVMPTLPVLQIGLSPILQWIIIPVAAFLWAGRRTTASV